MPQNARRFNNDSNGNCDRKGRRMTDTDERASIEERYTAATNATDLTADPDRRGAVDLLIASGLSQGWLGRALLHLAAEWAIADKPRRWTSVEIAKRASEMPARKGKPDLKGAEARLIVEHARAMREAFAKLHGRAQVLAHLVEWADEKGVDRDLLSPALYHYFEKACAVCSGHGRIKAEDAPVLTDRACYSCQGSGTWPQPLGSQRVLNHIADCIGRARSGIAGNQARARELKQLVRVR